MLSGYILRKINDSLNRCVVNFLIEGKYVSENINSIVEIVYSEVVQNFGSLKDKDSRHVALEIHDEITALLSSNSKYEIDSVAEIESNVDRIIANRLNENRFFIEETRKGEPVKSPKSLNPDNLFHKEVLDLNDNGPMLCLLFNKYAGSPKGNLVLLCWIEIAREDDEFECLYTLCPNSMRPNLLRRMFEVYALDVLSS